MARHGTIVANVYFGVVRFAVHCAELLPILLETYIVGNINNEISVLIILDKTAGIVTACAG